MEPLTPQHTPGPCPVTCTWGENAVTRWREDRAGSSGWPGPKSSGSCEQTRGAWSTPASLSSSSVREPEPGCRSETPLPVHELSHPARHQMPREAPACPRPHGAFSCAPSALGSGGSVFSSCAGLPSEWLKLGHASWLGLVQWEALHGARQTQCPRHVSGSWLWNLPGSSHVPVLAQRLCAAVPPAVAKA